MAFEALLFIGMCVLGLMAYTWFVVELAWEVVIRRMDRYEQERDEELNSLNRMLQDDES
jgi:hypothetical protein